MIASSELKIDELRRNAIEQAFLKTLETIKLAVNGQGPSCFVSHAWKGSEPGEESGFDLFALKLKDYLTHAGVYAFYDEKSRKEGQHAVPFMNQIGHSRFILILFTKDYKDKSELPNTGVYQEIKQIEERLRTSDEFYIPILLSGEEGNSIPSCLDPAGRSYEDFRDLNKLYSKFFKILKEKLFHNLDNINIDAKIKLFKNLQDEYENGQHDGDLIDVWKAKSAEIQKKALEEAAQREEFHKTIIAEQLKETSLCKEVKQKSKVLTQKIATNTISDYTNFFDNNFSKRESYHKKKIMLQKLFWVFKRKIYILILLIIFCPASILVYTIIKQNKKQQTQSVQSDLTIPIKKNLAKCSRLIKQRGNELKEDEDSYFKEETMVRSDFKIPTILLERPELIGKIKDKLSSNKGINAVALIGVVGIGGAGKTVLARQYGKFCKSQVVWELNAERKESLISSFQDLAFALAKTSKQKQEVESINIIQNIEEKEKKLLSLVQRWLKEKQNWLLIYDNVENISSIINYFPQDPQVWGNGKVIITTRDSNIGNTPYIEQESVIEIEELTDNEKLLLFSKIFYNKLPAELISEQKLYVVNFLKAIPPFPLDVSVAAYYLKITGTSFEKYLKNLSNSDADFERIQSVLLKEMGGYTKTRYNIVTMSLEHLIYPNNDFKDLVLFISLLDSQNIPRELLSKYKPDTVVDEIIYNLKKYSFITNEPSSALGSFFSIHRSTQAIILGYLVQNLHLEQNKKILETIADALEEYITFLLDKEDFNGMKSILNHCEAFLEHRNILTDKITICIKASLGSIYHYTSYNSKKAVEILEDSFLKLRQYSDKDALRARTMTLLGDLYRKLGNYDKAEKLLQESCVIYANSRKRTMGEAYSLASFGLFYQATSQYQKARELLERSVSIYKIYPESSIGRARVLAYLGLTHADLGLYREAISYMEKSQKIYKNQIEFHHRLSWILMYVGDIHRKLGDYKKAEEILKESIGIQEKYFYDTRDIDRLRVFSYLGIVHGERGDYKQAMNYIDQSLHLYKEYYPKSFDRIWTAAHLAEIYRKVENYQKAQILIEDSLAIHNNNIVNQPVDIRGAWLIAKLGSIHNDQGNHREAWKLVTRSLNTYEKQFGKDNIKTAKILFRLGEVYKNLEQYEEAIKIFKDCLIQYKKNYGDKHVRTAELMNNLALIYMINNNLTQAEELLNKALNIFNESKHNGCYIILESLGDLYRKRAIECENKGDSKQSKILMIQAIDRFEQAIKVLKTVMQREDSPNIIRLQAKLKGIMVSEILDKSPITTNR